MLHKLEVDSVELQFGNKSILSSIYLKCETGKITGLLGRNGQGKSCLMEIIYGTLSCEKSVRIDSVSKQELFKSPSLLVYCPQFSFIPKFLSLKRVFQDFTLDFQSFSTRFPEFVSNYNSSIGSLSGGGQRLVELYVIVKSNSKFAILDEPFTHISPLQIEKVKEMLLEEKSNKGLLISDHMYSQVLDLCDDIYLLADRRTHLTQSLSEIAKLGYLKT